MQDHRRSDDGCREPRSGGESGVLDNARNSHLIHDRPEKLDEFVIDIDGAVPLRWAPYEQICIALLHPPGRTAGASLAEYRHPRDGRQFRQARTLPTSGIWAAFRPVE
ncbi:hypothetical protein GCM10023317_61840 [Actinopolymorpha pittospori]|uniref:Uncharacterized protein n=1 Tax=Actinopolymorpha pittospori TaxID=648752 RepID=A0A927N5S8_9ACTN|nr:hypothetical protein [Actinopolymorpha pittospori]